MYDFDAVTPCPAAITYCSVIAKTHAGKIELGNPMFVVDVVTVDPVVAPPAEETMKSEYTLDATFRRA
jgi:hypothetical protein